MQSDARKSSGFNRDILEWNIPEDVAFVCIEWRSGAFEDPTV